MRKALEGPMGTGCKAPPAPPAAPTKTTGRWVTEIGLVLIFVAIVGGRGSALTPMLVVAMIGVVLIIGYWGCRFAAAGGRTVRAGVEAASTPIPSLIEIELQLRREGYNPTIADCVAIEAHLKSERNEKIAAGAIVLGGTVAAARIANGKPLL